MSHDVFVSYASRDGSHVPQVLDQLRKQDVLSVEGNVFADRDSLWQVTASGMRP